ncbi:MULTISPECIES: DUF3311 domain-containing protein [Dactylosporangium]|uniref:DUF3311 domain-containing protein n=2 Tax=Dactylosporangium TaxID=35753 RepID=A0A9W6NR14_9ACTN|nr:MULTISPECIES: DUF3311 domain-containing protein [Dactylosporangium]UAB99509.1 DUF3311 domain-containing protein [Dactylosporangium vinaceum]UWZ47734.1 DUF3311 domain-containing protein [Dactylosporangium matsuzakiense]GLL06119.1 hypothetical protein GCM10017581_078670 [Dactylosporangium matsuzakiense]
MAPPARRRSGYWLLAIPTIAPLLTPLYDRATPMVWGIPFFYTYQMACVLLAMVILVSVHARNRRRDWELRNRQSEWPR